MRIVTYNIHKARGMDGRVSIKRIADVLSGLDADIIALQEISSACDSSEGQVETLESELGFKSVFGRTRHHRGRPYGNALLSRWPIIGSCDMDLTWGQHHPKRGCIRADLKTPFGPLHVFNIHLGMNYFERRYQVKSLLASKEIHEGISGPRVLVGDFNEWIKGLTTRLLSDRFESLNLELLVRKRRTYPGFLPLVHLDHIYFERPLRIEMAELVRNRVSRVASDHLPLVATFNWNNND